MVAPTASHQAISINFSAILKNYIKQNQHSCHVFHAPFDVRFLDAEKSQSSDKDIFTVVQPDICVICDRTKIDKKGCLGAPDFIIEILSENNRKHDLNYKFELYEAHGVKEYWIAFPSSKMIQKFVLENECYQFRGNFVEDDCPSPDLFPDLAVNLLDVFEDI